VSTTHETEDLQAEVARWIDQWGSGASVPVLRCLLGILTRLDEVARALRSLDARLQATERKPRSKAG